MEELKTIGTYQEFKKALDTELYNQTEGFVRTGYLLKVARDTDILRESGYATVAEFAHAEYGLTKDVVSRYIAINDRYSEGGYSDRLQEQYQGYGVAKLQDMLTLPDAIIEVMSPEMTRKDIQEVKRGYKEEEANPLASLMETPKIEQQDMTTLQQAMHQYLHDNREEFTKGFDVAMRAETEKEEALNGILDAFAPSGVGIKTARIQGVGRVVISFRGKDAEVEVLNARTQERRSYSWQQFIDELREVFMVGAEESGAEAWERIYKEEYEEKKEEVAPVQLPEETTEPVAVMEEDDEEDSEEEEDDEEEGEEEAIPMGTASLADIVTGNVPKPTPEEIDEAKKKLEVEAEPQTLHDIQPDIPEPDPMNPPEEQGSKSEQEVQQSEEQVDGQKELADYPGVVPEETNQYGQRVHKIKIDKAYFEKTIKADKNFELRKNDRGYREGDILEMAEVDGGEYTGRKVRVLVTYMLEGYEGLADGYCIMSTWLLNDDGTPLNQVDLNRICRNLRANGDGVTESGEEYIEIENAIGIIEEQQEE